MPSAVRILIFGDFNSAEPRTFSAHPPPLHLRLWLQEPLLSSDELL